MNQFPDRYESVIAIRPSGWEKNSKPQYRGRINIVGIEYSEHSSFDELKRFVQFLRPHEVISTVPYGNSNQNRTPTVPVSWYQGEIRPQRKALQLSMTNFIALTSEKNSPMPNPSSSTLKASCLAKRIKLEANRATPTSKMISEIIDLDSSEEERSAQKSENGEYSFDSDWLP